MSEQREPAQRAERATGAEPAKSSVVGVYERPERSFGLTPLLIGVGMVVLVLVGLFFWLT